MKYRFNACSGLFAHCRSWLVLFVAVLLPRNSQPFFSHNGAAESLSFRKLADLAYIRFLGGGLYQEDKGLNFFLKIFLKKVDSYPNAFYILQNVKYI